MDLLIYYSDKLASSFVLAYLVHFYIIFAKTLISNYPK
jgi:hypothetical protein